MKTLLFFSVLFYLPVLIAFEPCADISAEPTDAPKLYEIVPVKRGAKLSAVKSSTLIDPRQIFEAVNENHRFTTYRCWDKNHNTTGFDPQLITEIVAHSGQYKYIRFHSIPWEEPTGEPISFFSHLDQALLKASNLQIDSNGNIAGGSVAQAGMSITEERLKWGTMVGPIYRAGKVLIGRLANDPNLLESLSLAAPDLNLTSSKVLKDLMSLPTPGEDPYEALRGLTLVTEGHGTIRGDYFIEMEKRHPGTVAILTHSPELKTLDGEWDEKKLNVVLTSNEIINELVNSKLLTGQKVLGLDIDLTMVDSGSIHSLKEEGKIDGEFIDVVTRNLSLVDKELSFVFGLGDGIVVSKANDEMKMFMEKNLSAIICSGRLEELVTRWFKDSNSADLSWADCQ